MDQQALCTNSILNTQLILGLFKQTQQKYSITQLCRHDATTRSSHSGSSIQPKSFTSVDFYSTHKLPPRGQTSEPTHHAPLPLINVIDITEILQFIILFVAQCPPYTLHTKSHTFNKCQKYRVLVPFLCLLCEIFLLLLFQLHIGPVCILVQL